MSKELTQYQFQEQLMDVHLGSVEVRVKSMACLRNHDAAQRATIQQLAAMTAERDGLLAAKWVQQTDTHSKLCIALQQLAVMTQESADAKAQLAQESQDSINKQTIIDGLRSERARNECVLIKLKQRLAKMDATLTAIAGYAGENGCCPYGCDTPYIAQQALFKDHHDI